jgi:hypothetical protein
MFCRVNRILSAFFEYRVTTSHCSGFVRFFYKIYCSNYQRKNDLELMPAVLWLHLYSTFGQVRIIAGIDASTILKVHEGLVIPLSEFTMARAGPIAIKLH